jgi:hypothetical protein
LIFVTLTTIPAGKVRMYSASIVRWMFAAGLLIVAAGLAAPEGKPQTAPDGTSELRSGLEQVAKAKQSLDRDWVALQASSGGSAAGSSDFAAEWMRTVAPNGPGATPFYAGTEEILATWISAVESGEEKNPPADDIRAALENWRETHARILESLDQSAKLERSARALELRLAKLKPESDAYNYYKAQLDQQQLTIRKLLSDAGSDLASAAALPHPNRDSDRSPSPFAGTATPGEPDRLWIYLRKVSAPIGESIPVEIGLANDRGPNVTAVQSYTVSLTCDGCRVSSESVIILNGKRFAPAELWVTAATAHLRAKSPGLGAAAEANAYGCYTAPSVSLASEQDRSFGPADGATPIPFRFAFYDSHGQRATDGRRKAISPRLTGVGERVSMQEAVGAILSKDGSIVVPANECVAAQGVVPDLAGTAKIEAASGAEKAEALHFTFEYAFPWLDRVMMLLGALAGFLANYAITLRKQIHWALALLSSAIGSTIFIAGGYMEVLNVSSLHDTWLVALALAAAGGVLGVSAARFLVHKIVPAGSKEEITESVQGAGDSR